MRKATFFICLTLFTFKLHATEDFGDLYQFSEDIRDIILETPGGHPTPKGEFHLSSMQADQMAALASMDDSMREHLEDKKTLRDCDQKSDPKIALQKRIDERTFKVEAVILSSNRSYDQIALGRFMTDDYSNFMSQLYSEGNYKVFDIYTLGFLEQKYKHTHPEVNYNNLSITEKEQRLNEVIKDHIGVNVPSGMLFKELAFRNMVNNSGDWKKTLTEVKDKLTTEQKVQLVSKLGGYFSNNYNYERSSAGKKAYGTFVDSKTLLDSVKNATPGGICRDIALAQTQFLEALGFNNNYVVTYKTYNNRHATVITTDPDTKEIIKFNYSEMTKAKAGSGTEALTQDTSIPDYGLAYRIYDTNGKSVTKVSNEVTKMLQSSTGADDGRNFSEKTYSIAKVGFQSDLGSGNLFTGKTSTGLTLYGVSLHNNHSNDYLKLGYGAAVSKLSGVRSQVKIDQTSLYLRANAEINTPDLKIGPTKTSLFAGGSAEALIANVKQNSIDGTRIVEGKKTIDGDMDGYFGVRTKIDLPNEKTSIDSKVYVNIYPDLNHVATVEKRIAARDNITVQTGVSHKLTEDTKALIDTAVVIRNYGSDVIIKGVYANEGSGLRVTAGAAAPLSKNIPSFLPGAQKRVMASIEKTTPRFVLVIEVEKNLTNKSTNLGIKAQRSF